MKTVTRQAVVLAALAVGGSANAALFVNQYGIGTNFSPLVSIKTAVLPPNPADNNSGRIPEGNWGGENMIGQSFTATETGNLAYFEISHASAGETTLSLSLFDMGTGPFDEPWNAVDAVGGDLLAGRSNVATVGGNSQNVLQFYFTGTDEIPVVAGRRYMFRIQRSNGDFFWYRNANGDFYTAGDGYRYTAGPLAGDPDGTIIRGGSAVRDMALGVGYAQPPGWQVNGGGNWDDNANWRGGVPDGPGLTANFTFQLSSGATVNLGNSRSVGHVVFNSANGYTLTGSTLVLDNTNFTATVTVAAGSHTIEAPLSIVSNLAIAVNAAESTLTLTQPVQSALGITKSGPGALVSGDIDAASLTISGGAVSLTGTGVSVLGALALTGGTLATGTTDMIVDYSGSSPIEALIAAVAAGTLSANGDDNGLPTYLAIAEAADLGSTEFGGVTVDDTAVLLKFTYVGDANLDGQVDALDYERIDLAIGNSGVFGTAQGDLNYDGTVDALDYEQVDLNIGNGVGSPLAGVTEGGRFIPEPASLSLVAMAGGLLGRRRR
jgi:hypothetical protein